MSVSSAGAQTDGLNSQSQALDISADGRYVLFASLAQNLVAGDTNVLDLFVRDRMLGTTELVDVSSSGVQANASVGVGVMSRDGRYVAFSSSASNLVAGDTNARIDVFLRDRQTGTTERVSLTNSGAQATQFPAQMSDTTAVCAVSDDGRFVAFVSRWDKLVSIDGNGLTDVYVRDRQAGTTQLITINQAGSGASGGTACAMGGDGSRVVFASNGANLIPSQAGGTHIYLRDRSLGTTSAVDVALSGQQASLGARQPTISANGSVAGFNSTSTDLVTAPVSSTLSGYVRDLSTGTNERVDVDSFGNPANDAIASALSLSANGTIVGFASAATNLVCGQSFGMYVRDRLADGSTAPACDTTAPTISVTSPVRDALYSLGQTVVADYSCQDEPGGSGLASCVGSAPNGSPIDTSTGGLFSFAVDASDAAGNHSHYAADYQVLAGSVVQTVTPPATVTTDPGNVGASPAVPVQTSVTVSSGTTLTLTVESSPTWTLTPPTSYTFLGSEITIDAYPGPVPATITFRLDSSVLAASGADASTLAIFRDGTQLPTCLPLEPGPCVQSRSTAGDGDAVIVVVTPQESTWDFGIHTPYAFSGFFQPVDNLPTTNSVKAGRGVPVKFSLGGNQGLAVLVGGYPKSQAIACDSSAPVDAIEQTVTAGASSLSYDATTDQYTYVWKTDSTWATSSPCRQLILKFIDGSTHRANFSFTK